jgi:predicted DNA-binding protein
MKPSKDTVITVRLTSEQRQRVKDIATSRSTTISKVIREQITRLIEKWEKKKI